MPLRRLDPAARDGIPGTTFHKRLGQQRDQRKHSDSPAIGHERNTMTDTCTSDYKKFKAAAERLAGQANHFTYGDGGDAATGHALAAEAQVYATLALAEATQEPQTVRIDAP